MANRVKGITVVLGGDTTGLDKALSGTNKKIKETQRDLRDVERLLKMDPGNVQLLAQKQRLLKEEVGQTKDKLLTLKDAERQVQQQFAQGTVPQQQYDALQREIVETQKALENLEKKAKHSSVALGQIGSAADKISTGAGKIKSTFAPVTAGVVGLATAAVATVGATEELRSDLSKLDNAARDQAVEVDAARDAWKDFAVATDETDSAVEATANLLQAGFTESNLQKAVEGLTGAYLKFPDTLKVEGLADSLQETLATGKGVGQFAELLERMGYNLDDFNARLAQADTEAEKQNLVLETLAEGGLMDTYTAWRENNAALAENKEANLQLQESFAALAAQLLPLVTKVVTGFAGLIDQFTALPPSAQGVIVTVLALLAAISPVAGMIDGVSKAISFLAANPMVALVAAIVALVALVAIKGDEIQAALQKFDDWLHGKFFPDWTEIFGPGLGNAIQGFAITVQTVWESIVKVLSGIIDFVRGVFTGDWSRAWQGIADVFEGIWDGLAAIIKAPTNAMIGILNALISGVNHLIGNINKLSFNVPDWVPELGGKSWGFHLPQLGQIPFLAKGGVLSSGAAIVGEAGPELLTMSGGAAKVQPLTGSSTTNFGGITINIQQQPWQDARALADEVATALQDKLAVEGGAYA